MDSAKNENTVAAKWDKICRVCLTDEAISLTSIKLDSVDDQYKLNFGYILNICSGINYSPTDHFPQLICSLCITHMYNALEFRVKCQASENLLTKLLYQKEGLNTTIKCEENPMIESDTETDNRAEDDPNQNVMVTDYLKVDYSSTSKRKNESTALNDSLTPIYSKKDNLPNMLTCSVCQTAYNSLIKLTRCKKVMDDACWQCNINLDAVESNDHLKITPKDPVVEKKRKRTPQDKYLCTTCGKELGSTSALSAHMKAHNKIPNKNNYLCIKCGKDYHSSSALIVHNRTAHKGEKRYECSYCGKKFLHWDVRRYHIRSVHTMERPYSCEICGKTYIKRAELTIHIRSHTGEKTYECSKCDKKFQGRSHLRRHMDSHTGVKRVFCDFCGKGFKANYCLKLHMVTHTGERNHVCSICNKAFTQAHVLRTHMKLHPEAVTSTEKQTTPEKSIS